MDDSSLHLAATDAGKDRRKKTKTRPKPCSSLDPQHLDRKRTTLYWQCLRQLATLRRYKQMQMAFVTRRERKTSVRKVMRLAELCHHKASAIGPRKSAKEPLATGTVLAACRRGQTAKKKCFKPHANSERQFE